MASSRVNSSLGFGRNWPPTVNLQDWSKCELWSGIERQAKGHMNEIVLEGK